ncbi:hypothetical protein TPHA_0A05150 [Tetrapisispora phaffii CBS 4417]|uniref:Uncharacterized protein n=1 Tax=Tetrapisispora phaffii (strain ATCC 24235 / CBS 4417 / NBRC 1672 / NRRL Y-8282 / UCD 70-5) TaxID=1071381 RepID=G8BNW2_TETPH|nr:hypothetical protein TPHA_0A05150 [Tetrapisispora phaffii CBS 4417]CCE61590.1 hypothetical protein TPHA_0A05150 [Tetrapisispora phaffii CBS 4417]
MARNNNFVNSVSFDNLSPSYVDDQVTILKKNHILNEYNNEFLYIPPQFNLLYHNNSITANDGSDERKDVFKRRPLLDDFSSRQNSSTDQSFHQMFTPICTRAGSPSFTSATRGVELHNIERTTSHYSLTNETRLSPRLPPPPNISSIKYRHRNIDEPEVQTEPADIAHLDTEMENHMKKLTVENTQVNSGSKGFTQSAFSNLNELEDRLDTSGKVLKLLPNKNDKAKKESSRKKSFADMTDEEIAALETSYRSLARSNPRSTIADFDFKQQDSLFIGVLPSKGSSNNSKIDPLAVVYPSKPVVSYKAVTISKKNKLYDEFISKFIHKIGEEKFKNIRKNKTALRTVLCYISGRKYTWSAVDWFIQNQIREGDHLVILACIPEYEEEVVPYPSKINETTLGTNFSNETTSFNSKSTKLKRSDYVHCSARLKAIHDQAITKAEDICDYYSSKLNNKPIKITVEIVKEKSRKAAITQSIKVYNPDWQLVSTVSIKLQIKFRNGNIKLPYFMMKDLFTPTCIVPYEFMDPSLTSKIHKFDDATESPEKNIQKQEVSKQLEFIDDIFMNSVKNPFLPKNTSNYDHDTISVNTKYHDASSTEDVDTINEFRPIGPEQQQKIDLFEKIGYVRPTPTHQEPTDPFNIKLTPSRSSGRSSRIQFTDEVYKIRSMVDDVSDISESTRNAGLSIRKTKSEKTSTNYSKHDQKSTHSQSSKKLTPISSSSPPLSNKSKKLKKKKSVSSKKGLKSLFKKLF